jgi:hypothetical protein
MGTGVDTWNEADDGGALFSWPFIDGQLVWIAFCFFMAFFFCWLFHLTDAIFVIASCF